VAASGGCDEQLAGEADVTSAGTQIVSVEAIGEGCELLVLVN
jgi:hypothetical protein